MGYHREYYEGGGPPANSPPAKLEKEQIRAPMYEYGMGATEEGPSVPVYTLQETSSYETCYGLYRENGSSDGEKGEKTVIPKSDGRIIKTKNKRSHAAIAPRTPLRSKKSKSHLGAVNRLRGQINKASLENNPLPEAEHGLQMPLLDSRSLLNFFRSPDGGSKRSQRDSDQELSDTGDREHDNETTTANEPGARRFMNMLPMPMASHLISSEKADTTPRLIRTSEIGRKSPPDYLYGGAYTNKDRDPEPAILEIIGDLGLVVSEQWSDEEVEQSRRLVAFERQQVGRVLRLSHKVVSQQVYEEEYGEDDTVVSCIWDRHSKTCYITSADVLSIMECLVGAPFYMTEKNRLRRNLEYARPQTVSKSGEFSQLFKLIMSYNEPRPRKIVKDTKVIKWDLLGKSLHKLISKYSTI